MDGFIGISASSLVLIFIAFSIGCWFVFALVVIELIENLMNSGMFVWSCVFIVISTILGALSQVRLTLAEVAFPLMSTVLFARIVLFLCCRNTRPNWMRQHRLFRGCVLASFLISIVLSVSALTNS